MNNIRGHFCIVVGLSQRKRHAWPYQLNCSWIQRQPEICSSLTRINNLFCRRPLWSHQSRSRTKAWPAAREGGTRCFMSRSVLGEVRLRCGLPSCPTCWCPRTKMALPLWAPTQGWGCWIKGGCEIFNVGCNGQVLQFWQLHRFCFESFYVWCLYRFCWQRHVIEL